MGGCSSTEVKRNEKGRDENANQKGSLEDSTDNNNSKGGQTTRPSLHVAAKNGDIPTLNGMLLYKNVAEVINSLDDDRLSPLHYAIRHDHLDVVKQLVKSGADLNLKTELDVTPLHIAARYNGGKQKTSSSAQSENAGTSEAKHSSMKQTTISFLMGKRACVIDAKDVYGSTPLHYAAMRRNGEFAVDELIRAGKRRKKSDFIEAKDNQGMTPLHVACMHQNVYIVQKLKEQGAKLDAEDDEKRTPFHLACFAGSFDICKNLLNHDQQSGKQKNKPDINKMLIKKDQSGSTAVHHAVRSGSTDCLNLCLDPKNYKHEEPKSKSIVAESLRMANEVEIFRILLKKLEKSDINDQCAIHMAATNNKMKIIELLIEKGANLELQDSNNQTALLIASSRGHYKIVECLLKNGADLKKTDINGKSVFFLAAESDSENAPKTVQALIEKCRESKSQQDANLMIMGGDNYANTPLHIASEKGHLDIVKILIKQGADYEDKNFEENTPIHLAAKNGMLEVVKELIDIDKKSMKNSTGNKIDISEEIAPESSAEQHGTGKTKFGMGIANIFKRGKKKEKSKPRDEKEAKPKPKEEDNDDELNEKQTSIVMARNDIMNTPLHLAALGGHIDTVKLLIKENADILNAKNVNLWTALDCAAFNGCLTTVTYLIDVMLKKGSSIDPLDKSKNTPLHLASTNGHEDVVKILLKKGADISKKNLKRKNCLDLAIENNHQ
ncbi:uncharacterized protein LOC144433285 [Glandiceps talaboti]